MYFSASNFSPTSDFTVFIPKRTYDALPPAFEYELFSTSSLFAIILFATPPTIPRQGNITNITRANVQPVIKENRKPDIKVEITYMITAIFFPIPFWKAIVSRPNFEASSAWFCISYHPISCASKALTYALLHLLACLYPEIVQNPYIKNPPTKIPNPTYMNKSMSSRVWSTNDG